MAQSQIKKKDKVVIILDQSGSMGGLSNQVKSEFKKTLKQLQSYDHKIDLTVILFNYQNSIHVAIDDVPVQEVHELPYYTPYGGTALCQAVDVGIQKFMPLFLKDKKNAKSKRWSYLFITLTDGQENDSSLTVKEQIKEKIKELQASDYWTFTFQVPRFATDLTVSWFGVHRGNVTEWETTEEGFKNTQHLSNVGTQNYMAARCAGKTAVQSFYSDLSKVKDQDLNNLDDLSWRFKAYKVDKELAIKPFFEYKTAKPYLEGSGYYCLTKTEKIQDDKEIVLRKVGEKDILGGQGKVRGLLGLPSTGTVKVTPKNHNGYEIFVQSKAPNRKLVRGTEVLLDKLQTTASTPTWQ